ncbi:hypothetical protein CHELA20_11451 [Hyphomicrobiales bacterium]|nr:hypothetical protein CHELA20_11451 [Hyphomicrobiales bacterium]CAH1695871.1 hypothetical protein CHELA41_51697 [Hyphomicrobiales bacterium]
MLRHSRSERSTSKADDAAARALPLDNPVKKAAVPRYALCRRNIRLVVIVHPSNPGPGRNVC